MSDWDDLLYDMRIANIDDLDEVARAIRELLAPDGVFVFESFYLGDLVRNMVFDFLYHEHLSAFSVGPLELFFAQYRRVWRGTVVSSIVTPVVYLLALGVGMSKFVRTPLSFNGESYGYLELVAPGLLAATAMQIAAFEASWPVLSAIKWSRQYHAMLAAPLRVKDLVTGHQAFIAIRIFVTVSVYLVAITAFGNTGFN